MLFTILQNSCYYIGDYVHGTATKSCFISLENFGDFFCDSSKKNESEYFKVGFKYVPLKVRDARFFNYLPENNEQFLTLRDTSNYIAVYNIICNSEYTYIKSITLLERDTILDVKNCKLTSFEKDSIIYTLRVTLQGRNPSKLPIGAGLSQD
jgi:hypothetical protein